MIHVANMLSNHFSFNFVTDFAILKLDVLKSTQISIIALSSGRCLRNLTLPYSGFVDSNLILVLMVNWK